MATYDDFNASTFFAPDTPAEDYCLKPANFTSYPNCSDFQDYETCYGGGLEKILYDEFEFDSTIATEFDLVCDQEYKVVYLC